MPQSRSTAYSDKSNVSYDTTEARKKSETEEPYGNGQLE